jgi:hypothetical protein
MARFGERNPRTAALIGAAYIAIGIALRYGVIS